MTRAELIEAINQTGRPNLGDAVLAEIAAVEAERDSVGQLAGKLKSENEDLAAQVADLQAKLAAAPAKE